MPVFSRRRPFALIAELAERGGELKHRTFQPLDAPETDIGRGVPRPGAGSLQLPQLWVSRCHATIRRSEDDRFYLHVHGRAGCDVARHGSSQHLGCADAPWLLSPQDEIFVCGGPASDRVHLHFVELFSNDDAAIWWCEELKSKLPCVVESPAKPNGSYAVAAQLPQRVWHGNLQALEDVNSHADEAGQETQCEPASPEQSCLSTRRRCALMGGVSGRKDSQLFVTLDAAWTDIGRSACPGPNVLQLTQAWVSRQHARIRKVEDDNGAVYSVLVESRLGIDVLRNGQQHHLPKASPPWQLSLGDVITFRAPPSATSPQQSVELRFVDVFSRADAAIYRVGDSASTAFPCVVDSSPWPDGTYDVRIRAEAWHGHLTARVAEVAEEEPMTQMQDTELADTQAGDDLGCSPVRVPSLFSMLPPPLPPPRATRETDVACTSSDVHVTDPVRSGGDLVGCDGFHDGAEGSGAKRSHPEHSEVDVGAEDECPKKAVRLSMPVSSSGPLQGTCVGVAEEITHCSAEQDSKCVAEQTLVGAKRHREDEGFDRSSVKSARCDTSTVVEANGDLKTCGVPPANDEVQTCTASDPPANQSGCESAGITNGSVESAEDGCSSTVGRNAVVLEEGSLWGDPLVERVARLRAQAAATPSVTSSNKTHSTTAVEPLAEMHLSAQDISQQSSQLQAHAIEQPIGQPIEQPVEKQLDQTAVVVPSTHLPDRPLTSPNAQTTAVQVNAKQYDVAFAVDFAAKKPSELRSKEEAQGLAAAPAPCASTPQRSSAGTDSGAHVVVSPSSSEKTLAPAQFCIEGTDSCLDSNKSVSNSPRKENSICESKDQQAHRNVLASDLRQRLQARSADKDSKCLLVELPVGLVTEPAAEPLAKLVAEPISKHVVESVAETPSKSDPKPSVVPSSSQQEQAAQPCALSLTNTFSGPSPYSSLLSRQSAQLFVQPIKHSSPQPPAQSSTQCAAQLVTKPLARPLSNQLANQAGSADEHQLNTSQAVGPAAVSASGEKKSVRSKPRQDTPVKEIFTQELPTQVVPTQEVPSQEEQAGFAEAPDVSPTQRDASPAASDAPPCVEVSCAPSTEQKAVAPKDGLCNTGDQPSHQITAAMCVSQEAKARDVKASQTEGMFRRTDTCIAQEVETSAKSSLKATVDLPVEPSQNDDDESEAEEDVQVVEASAELLESQAVWSASDCE